MSEPANPGTPDDGATPAPEATRKIAPIPPGKGTSAPRNPDGTFAATGDRVDDGGLPDILKETDSVADDHDRAKATLDGGEPQNIRPLAHKTTKTRAKDVLRAAKPEGAPESDPNASSDGVAPLPDGAQPQEEGGPEGGEPGDQPQIIIPPGAKLIVAGTEYRDLNHLDQSLRSLRGMYVSETKRSATRADIAKQNYEAAVAWQGRANAAEARLSGAVPPSGSPAGVSADGSSSTPVTGAERSAASQVAKATGDTTEHVLKTIDWDKYKQIREKYDPETALAYMVQEALTAQQARFDARLDEMTRPAKERDSVIAEGGKIGDQMDVMSEWQYDGSADPIYPELADPEAYDEIAQVIVKMHAKGWPLSVFQTQEGVHTAVLTWRDWRNRNRRPWSKSSPTPTAAPDPHAAAAASVRAAAGAGALTGRSAPVRPAPATEGRGADIVRGITESSKPTEFGWPR